MLHDDAKSETFNAAVGANVAQAGAICYRRDKKGRLEVLLVGSRRNGRWGVPKGHVESREASSRAATREAFEEAGVVGVLDEAVFGSFSYQKDTSTNVYTVTVHLLQVSKMAGRFPEKDIRKQRWFLLKDAVREAAQPALRALLFKLENAGL